MAGFSIASHPSPGDGRVHLTHQLPRAARQHSGPREQTRASCQAMHLLTCSSVSGCAWPNRRAGSPSASPRRRGGGWRPAHRQPQHLAWPEMLTIALILNIFTQKSITLIAVRFTFKSIHLGMQFYLKDHLKIFYCNIIL